MILRNRAVSAKVGFVAMKHAYLWALSISVGPGPQKSVEQGR